uniref:Uncharacterized protein n=1 Tax=Photinus pyralis TaxID=7054 RepID=A0A1Y1KAR9_PHOPY
MGKKVKKTRWRTLTLNGHQSDSEESLLTAGDNYQRKYSKFSYSTHSSPIRKFEHDSSKTTRSNSTTSEKKATFNEDEYTRITTPRQDVLFKKGYLNKPKLYQTQTSTGTCSTANSTSTCTPDHQSADGMEGTDVEYESQFVFPNGFIDQNGIYYINSFEPFPFVVYNAPICYAEYPNSRTKRYSTDSMAESVSPQNEESGATNVSTQPSDEEQPVRLKKRRRRKVSPSKSVTSEASSDDVFKTEERDAQDVAKENKSELKADAEEFIPRNLQANVHFFNVPPNFIPVPFDAPPPFVPVNFISPAQNFVNVIPEVQEAKPDAEAKKKTDIDIAKIVWKLEEAAKEQDGKKSYKPKTRPRFGHYQNRDWKPKIAEAPAPPRGLRNAKPVEKKTEIKVAPSPVRAPRKSNQWIAVASRKKRKNKGVEEEEEEVEVVEEAPPLSDDLFESFDINQLVDVVPPSQLETAPSQPETGLPEIVTEPVKSEPDIRTPPPEVRKKKKKTIKVATKKVIVTDFPPVEVAEEQPCEPPACEVFSPPAPEETISTAVVEDKIITEEETAVKSPNETPEKKKKKKKKPAKSTSNPTPSSDCDTYDFLLDTSDDFDKKTNVEISQELDRMIQKGMYSSLEGKIRSMNIDLDDAFFRIVARSESPPRPSTSRGIFRWNLEEFQDKGEDNQNTPTITLTNVTSVPSEPILSGSPPPPPHYPITQAVREWMTRTRENTPDVDIFKSARELEGDEVVLWSAREAETEPKNTIEDCEEAIEVYESRYGNNEDFLRIRSEIAEEAQRNTRRSDLPYRAICCNLM